MHIFKYIMAVWMYSYPCICFAFTRITSYDGKFADDSFALIIFSALVGLGIIFNTKSRVFTYIKALLSLWFPISAIYHWLTTSEWNTINICSFAIYFAAAAVFAFAQLVDLLGGQNYSTKRYIYIPMALTLVLTVINIFLNEDAFSSMCITGFTFIMITQIIKRWFPQKGAKNTSEDEKPVSNPSYKKMFFRVLWVVLFLSVLSSAALYFMDANLLTKLTRPSAFYYTVETFMPLPGLIWLAICCFAPNKVSANVKSILLFIQSAIVGAKVFFDLRLMYADYLLKNIGTYVGLLTLVFFMCVYCYHNFTASKYTAIITGTACIVLTCVGFAVGSCYFDETSAAMLINIFGFICTLIDDHIADCKFKKDIKLLQAEYERENADQPAEEPVCVKEGKNTDN